VPHPFPEFPAFNLPQNGRGTEPKFVVLIPLVTYAEYNISELLVKVSAKNIKK